MRPTPDTLFETLPSQKQVVPCHPVQLKCQMNETAQQQTAKAETAKKAHGAKAKPAQKPKEKIAEEKVMSRGRKR